MRIGERSQRLGQPHLADVGGGRPPGRPRGPPSGADLLRGEGGTRSHDSSTASMRQMRSELGRSEMMLVSVQVASRTLPFSRMRPSRSPVRGCTTASRCRCGGGRRSRRERFAHLLGRARLAQPWIVLDAGRIADRHDVDALGVWCSAGPTQAEGPFSSRYPAGRPLPSSCHAGGRPPRPPGTRAPQALRNRNRPSGAGDRREEQRCPDLSDVLCDFTQEAAVVTQAVIGDHELDRCIIVLSSSRHRCVRRRRNAVPDNLRSLAQRKIDSRGATRRRCSRRRRSPRSCSRRPPSGRANSGYRRPSPPGIPGPCPRSSPAGACRGPGSRAGRAGTLRLRLERVRLCVVDDRTEGCKRQFFLASGRDGANTCRVIPVD